MQTCGECNAVVKLRHMRENIWRVGCECPDFTDFKPTQRATIIVPSKFPDIFEDCRVSVDKFAPLENKILVRDGSSIVPPDAWKTIQGPEGKFIYSRNVNLGIKTSTGDVLLMNDDCRFTHFSTLEIMQNLLSRHPEVGILSPRIQGDVGEPAQANVTSTLQLINSRLCFVCVLIRREVIEKVGLLDERFTGYGAEDCDYCRRVVDAGYRLGVTSRAVVKHGHGKDNRSASYNRQELGTIHDLDKIAMQQYLDKWGDTKLVY